VPDGKDMWLSGPPTWNLRKVSLLKDGLRGFITKLQNYKDGFASPGEGFSYLRGRG
jgi:hypothetical protein